MKVKWKNNTIYIKCRKFYFCYYNRYPIENLKKKKLIWGRDILFHVISECLNRFYSKWYQNIGNKLQIKACDFKIQLPILNGLKLIRYCSAQNKTKKNINFFPYFWRFFVFFKYIWYKFYYINIFIYVYKKTMHILLKICMFIHILVKNEKHDNFQKFYYGGLTKMSIKNFPREGI